MRGAYLLGAVSSRPLVTAFVRLSSAAAIRFAATPT
jgi:hypothetical protein